MEWRRLALALFPSCFQHDVRILNCHQHRRSVSREADPHCGSAARIEDVAVQIENLLSRQSNRAAGRLRLDEAPLQSVLE